jgi:hypothetical protein
VAKNRNRPRRPARRRGYAVVLALACFGCLGGLPAILSALHLKISAPLPTSSHGVRLLGAPSAQPAVPLSSVAQPVEPGLRPASFPQASATQEAAAVTAEDNRLRTMLHDSYRTYSPTVVPYRGALPTLVLTSGTHVVYSGLNRYTVTGQSAFTAADLIRYGALVRLPGGGALLQDNVFVAEGARLQLSSSDVSSVFLDDTAQGVASIVAWGGSLDFRGTITAPLTLKGWDEATMKAAADTGGGRPYIRAAAAVMTFENARVSALGFWSGRTGGVAWTGLSTRGSSGGATSTTFTGNTYGAFVSRAQDIHFTDDLFEANQLDGLHIHRGTVGATANLSAAVRNGSNGFHVDRDTQGTLLLDDVSEHNATNGFLVDGRPLVSTASPSGSGTSAGSGTRIENSAALNNGRTGILIEGGRGTVLKANEVCSRLTAIALRLGATDSTVDGNDVRCRPRTGISVGPVAPGTLLFGNAVSGARIAVVVTSAGGTVQIDKGLITTASIFGISVRGVNSIVKGTDNVISGIGFRTVDSRADARVPHLSGTDTANWQYAHHGTVLTYLEFHPLAVLWLSIAVLVVLCGLWVRRRRAPLHPYPESTRWRDPGEYIEPDPVPLDRYSAGRLKPTVATLTSLLTRRPAGAASHAWPVEPYRYGPSGTGRQRREPAVPAVGGPVDAGAAELNHHARPDIRFDFAPPCASQRGRLRGGSESADTDAIPTVRDPQ